MKEFTSLSRVRFLPGFPGRAVEKVVIAAFFIFLLLFSMQVYFFYRTTDRLLEAMIWVDQTHEIVDEVNGLRVNLRAMESPPRSSVINGHHTKHKEFLAHAMEEMRSNFSKIHEISSAYMTLRDPLAKIKGLFVRRFELMRESQRHYENGSAELEGLLRKSEETMNTLEQAFEEFTTEAQRLTKERIAKRESEVKRLEAFMLNITLVGGFFAVLALTIAFLGLYSRRKTEEMLRASLEEKNILLKEIHHRVKNNLQIISSLLILQGNKIKDPEAAKIFLACRERIQFMASLHQQLYSEGDFASLDFGKSLTEIAETLLRSHTPHDCHVTLDTRIEPLQLDIETSQVLGLIVSEVFLNALKHAFAGRTSGRIQVALSRGEEMNELAICDDGVGFSGENGSKGKSCAGIGLVEALAHQIRGKAEVSASPGGGVCFQVKFPPPRLQKENSTRNF
jgi:two-component sensor histidine kinase/CHASE3 domain sensor protein